MITFAVALYEIRIRNYLKAFGIYYQHVYIGDFTKMQMKFSDVRRMYMYGENWAFMMDILHIVVEVDSISLKKNDKISLHVYLEYILWISYKKIFFIIPFINYSVFRVIKHTDCFIYALFQILEFLLCNIFLI